MRYSNNTEIKDTNMGSNPYIFVIITPKLTNVDLLLSLSYHWEEEKPYPTPKP